MRLDEESLKFYDSAGTLRSTLTGGITGSGTTGLVGTNSFYIPTDICSAKFTIGNSTTSYLNIYAYSGTIKFDTSYDINFQTPIILPSKSSDPSDKVAGMIWFNTNTNKFRGYDGTDSHDLDWA